MPSCLSFRQWQCSPKSNWSRCYGAAGTIELIFGGLLLLGLFTRPVAFILSGEMAFAYFISHAPRSFFPVVNGGTLAIALCFACLYLSTSGGGAISLDAMLRKKV